MAVTAAATNSLVLALFEHFDVTDTVYCVARNYSGYPVVTGDIDLIVAEGAIDLVARDIRTVARQQGWSCFYQATRPYSCHIGFYKSVFPDRFALVIELSAGGLWHPVPFLSASDILSQRLRKGILWVPLAPHEAILTAMHHLLWNRRIPHKYRHGVKEIVLRYPGGFFDGLSKAVGAKLARFALQCVMNDDWQALEDKALWYLMQLNARAILRNPLRYASGWLNAYYQGWLSTQEGVVLIVQASDVKWQMSLCDALLSLADRWHLFLPTVREALLVEEHHSPADAEARIDKLVSRVMRRGGVAVLAVPENMALHFPLTHYPYLICGTGGNLIVEKCESNIFKSSPLISSLASYHDEGDFESAACMVWNSVLADRARLVREYGRSAPE